MGINIERLQIKVDIDTNQGLRNLTALQEKYELLIQKNKEAKGADKATTARELQAAKLAIDKERESLGLMGLTLKELRQYQRELNAEKSRYTKGTDQYEKAAQNATIVGLRIKELTSTQNAYENELKQTVSTQGIQALSIKQLEDYSKQLYNTISTGAKAGQMNQHALYEEWQKADEVLNAHKDSINRAKIAQSDYEEKIKETIKIHGVEGLTLEQLESHSKKLYDTISTGAAAGKVHEHALYGEFTKTNNLIKQSKDSLNQAKIAQDAYEKELRQTVETQGKEALSLQHLKEYYKLLKKEIEETSEFESEANQKRIQEAQQTDDLIAQRETEVKGTDSFFEQIKGQLPSAVAGAFGGMFVGLAQEISGVFFGALSSITESIKKKSREITEIQVALNITKGAAMQLNKELGDIRTETSVDELRKLVEVAGDLNVATEEVKGFVTEADKIGLVLGKDFGSTEEAVTMISKLKGEFRETRDLNFADSLAKIGSTLKGMNLDGPASTAGITDFLKRVGAIPDAIKPTLPQLAAFGALFEEANLSAEISGSGFSKILTVAANNTALFARQLRMSKKDLIELINTDPNQFVKRFAWSMQGLNAVQTAQSLKKIRLESDEVLKVVGVLTDNLDKLNLKQFKSNELFAEGATVNKIFGQYLNDEAGKIAQIEKKWQRAANVFSMFLLKLSSPLVMNIADASEKTKTLTEQYDEQKKKTDSLVLRSTELITKYTELSQKVKTNKTLQGELNQVIGQIATTMPGAVTQYDYYGRAISVNIGLLNEYIKKQKEATETAKKSLIEENVLEINKLGGLRKELNIKRDNMTKSDSKNIWLAEITQTNNQIDEITKKIAIKKQVVKDLNTEAAITPTPPLELDSKGGGGTGGDLTDAEKSKREAKRIAEQKFLQESTRKEIELQAQLAFEKDQALANEEDKKVQQAERNAEKRLNEIRNQFTDENGLVLKESELSFEQKKLIANEEKALERTLVSEVLAIRQDFSKKRAAQILEQTNRAIVIAQEAHTRELEEQLRLAELSKDSLRIFNAKSDLINNTEESDLAKLKMKFENEKIVLKDNQAAIKILETNYETEKTAIVDKGVRDRNILQGTTTEQDKERVRRAKEESLQVDLQAAKMKHVGVLQAEKALLDAQMEQELSAKNLTEQEKTNITRKYALLRKGIEKGSIEEVIQEAISAFSQAFSLIANIFRSSLQQRETDENDKYNSDLSKIQKKEETGVISKEKADAQKTNLEKKHNRELSIIKRDQAKIDKANNISQALINGVQAVLKSYAVLGPIGGPIAQGLIVALTAGSIAQIAAQPLPKVEGSYFDGGEMPNVFQNPVDNKGGGLIVAHPNEYMVPAWIRQQPVFADIEPTIEYMRKTGRSYDVGGPIGGTQNPTFPKSIPLADNSKIEELLTRNIEVQEMLMVRLQNIEVVVGYDAAEKILDTANQMKSIKDSAKA